MECVDLLNLLTVQPPFKLKKKRLSEPIFVWCYLLF